MQRKKAGNDKDHDPTVSITQVSYKVAGLHIHSFFLLSFLYHNASSSAGNCP
jgi:hypothetical protein